MTTRWPDCFAASADGKTTYVAQTVFQSVEDRDGAVQSGNGARQSMRRLTEVIQRLR